jgi:hypothetical protein
MFQLRQQEADDLRSQTVISSWGGRRTLPYAFTEQGVAMLSSVLRSDSAAQVNVEIIRTFVRLRGVLLSHTDLARKLAALERKYDAQFKAVFDAIRAMMATPASPKRKIGFRSEQQNGGSESRQGSSADRPRAVRLLQGLGKEA